MGTPPDALNDMPAQGQASAPEPAAEVVTHSSRGRPGRHRRVVITGLGAITPVGMTQRGLWNGILARKSALGSLTRFGPSEFRSHIAAEVRDFVPEDFLDRKRAKRLDRFGQFAVVSAQMAVLDAELILERENRERIGSMMGSALAGVAYAEEQLGYFLRAGVRAVNPLLALTVFGGAASCNIAIEFGLRGPNMTNGMSCAAGAIAIGEAFHQVRGDRADYALRRGRGPPCAPLLWRIRADSGHPLAMTTRSTHLVRSTAIVTAL